MVEAAQWYDQRMPGLGERLLRAIEATQFNIQKNPQLGTPYRRGTRKWRVPKFPYRVIYRDESERILIIAIAHDKRREGYWDYRLD
jgi:plasmid stabilization system protein ParE